MSQISAEQRFAMLAALGANIDWNLVTSDQVQVGIREAQRAGVEATAFIRNGFRLQAGDYFRKMEDLAIQIPALPRPTLEELLAKFPWIKSVERDTSPTGAVTLQLGTILLPDEERVGGTEYERRIAPLTSRLFGYQHLEWLVLHQDKHPAFKALLDKIYIDSLGLIVVGAGGNRNYPYLNKDGKRWNLNWNWIENDFNSNGRVAVSYNSW